MSRVRFGLPPDWSNAIPVHMFTNGFLYNSIRKKEQKQITLLKENNNTSFIFWKITPLQQKFNKQYNVDDKT